MTSTARTSSRTTARRGSYLAGALADIALLLLINLSPGWRAVPVLTEAAAAVVVVVDVALAVALVVNLLCLVRPRRPLTAVGDVVSTAAGLVALVRTAQVFPFTFADPATDWATIVRLTLVSIIVIVSIALLAQIVMLLRFIAFGEDTRA
ncbi:hypothetical protein [Lentzea flaviverrucosa]|uniref:Uncharacterized protein n=1 Tax=Lentzea flaviverrucosa TaxID=200379 RepID=A0A1H9XXS1_9PSEU|nr:hypothetical protein [Lentzea flaviverrucosa]RDI34356.1 hypothetical protein DFR72_101103 [Lentzea flaviverrucosa]SES50473.1 hypothetical protein SAMN05216195_120104 [Lentzea flaviverrucosa]